MRKDVHYIDRLYDSHLVLTELQTGKEYTASQLVWILYGVDDPILNRRMGYLLGAMRKAGTLKAIWQSSYSKVRVWRIRD